MLRPNPHQFGRKLHQTNQQSKPNRGKRGGKGDAGLPDELHLGAAWWETRGGGKARVFAGQLLPRADSERGEEA